MAKVRIKDIALSAGVSVGTVDRVIHGRGRVAKEVEEKVKKSIKLLNYQPNLAARSLAKQANHKIAIVLPSQEEDEFWIDQTKGILRALRSTKDFGFEGELITFNDQKKGELLKLSSKIFNGEYEALLIAPTVTGEAMAILDKCDELQIPYVQINSFIDRTGSGSLGYVGQDSYRSGQLAAKLLDFGINTAATVALLHMEAAVEEGSHLMAKEAGFKDYFERNNLYKVIATKITNLSTERNIQNEIEELLKNEPNLKGLFITTSRVHFISRILQMLGRQDITLIGFDIIKENIEALNEHNRLFLINQNPSLQGFYGVMRLFDHFLKHKTIRTTKYLPLGIVTLENVSNYLHIQDRDNVHIDKSIYG